MRRSPAKNTVKAPAKPKQLRLLKYEKSAYGGELLKTRAGRSRGRPLAVRETMHLVLRSTKAKGDWSFRREKNSKNIRRIVRQFSAKYGVRVLSMANVGNHLHLQIKLTNRFTYRPFICAITGAIAMAITRRTRWSRHLAKPASRSNKTEGDKAKNPGASRPNETETSRNGKFWDYRPFTRIVQSLRAFLTLRDYVFINQLEGQGYSRETARMLIEADHASSA